jgi:alkylated DNA repair protein (DNA oxidative demethylase)
MAKDYGPDMFLQGCGSEGTTHLNPVCLADGCTYFPQFLTGSGQAALLGQIRGVIAAAPLYTPTMPRTGKPFSVAMTNCGPLGWVSDQHRGYRYEALHPHTGKPWPPMPDMLEYMWASLTGYKQKPQACLVNFYGGKARLGLHRDEDEEDYSAPILSVSLGDSAIFRIGGLKRRDPVLARLELKSGDVLVMGGESRLRYHGIDRILPGTSDLLEETGRINLTLRRVTKAE